MANISLITKLRQLQPEVFQGKTITELTDELEKLHTQPTKNTDTALSEAQQSKREQEQLLNNLKAHLLRIELQNRQPKVQTGEPARTAGDQNKLWCAIEQSSSVIVITNNWGIIEYVNPRFTQLTGYSPDEVIGKNPRILKPDSVSSGDFRKMWETISLGKEWRGEFCNKKKDGELYWEFASISPVKDSNGAITHYVAVKEDITERKRADEERNNHLRELEDFMSFSTITNEATQEESLFKHLSAALRTHFMPDMVVIVMIDRERNMLYVPLSEPLMPVQEIIKNDVILDPSLCTVLTKGQMYVLNDIAKESPCQCLQHKIEKGGYISVPLTAGGKTFGMAILFKENMASWEGEKIRRLMSNYIGLTALALHRLELLDVAKHTNVTDEVTAVYSNRFFNELLGKQLSLAKRRSETLCLLIADVDHFKEILDNYGAEVGDLILQQVAGVLSDFLREYGVIARYGNDEFAIIMPAMSKNRALVLADDLRRIIESTDFEDGTTELSVTLTVSIGIATFPEPAADQESLIKYANKALYKAKEDGRNRIAAI